MKKLPFIFMYAFMIFFVLFFTSFLAPWRTPTAITFFCAVFCSISWVISEKVTKTKTRDGEDRKMNNDLMNRVRTITKSEYKALRRSRIIMRTLGAVMFVSGVILYPVLILNKLPFFVFLAMFCEMGGLVLFILSFALKRYAVLKYVKFEKESVGAPDTEPVPDPVPVPAPAPKSVSGVARQTAASDSARQTFVSNNASPPVPKPEESDGKPPVNNINERIFGCLTGGAAGDALGYPVEFLKYDEIIKRYGKKGITSYSLDRRTSMALISDDTQMTLFTAEGLLQQEGDEVQNIYQAYKNWLITQNTDFHDRPTDRKSDLLNRKELFSQRAPGNTCISALTCNMMGTVLDPINSSKGCGGVMRVSPIAFMNYLSPLELDKLAAQAAALTHGHPLGYLPAALLVHVLHKLIYENNDNRSLAQIVDESVKEFSVFFSSAPYLDDLLAAVNKAIGLSRNVRGDVENVRDIGEGWVAEETLAIAIYCALRHSDDFSAALAAAVNHDGDSDSTGALTGSILGAYLGDPRIGPEWKYSLELYDLILKTANGFLT